jgi:hypothetical protein
MGDFISDEVEEMNEVVFVLDLLLVISISQNALLNVFQQLGSLHNLFNT